MNAYNAYSSANAYKTQQILTAPPERLTLMLYDGAIRFIDESRQAIEKKNWEKAHNANMRVQNIVQELRASLDMQYEIAKNYDRLYEYVSYRLIQANLKKDGAQLLEARGILQQLRDAWAEAMLKVRQKPQAAVQ